MDNSDNLTKTRSDTTDNQTVFYQNKVPGPYFKTPYGLVTEDKGYESATGRVVPYSQLTPERMEVEAQIQRRNAIASVLYTLSGAQKTGGTI